MQAPGPAPDGVQNLPNQAASIKYSQSQVVLGKRHDLSASNKEGNSDDVGLNVDLVPSNSKIPLTNDISTQDPNRICFLNQCKFELSAEVIKWKEENHKLRREKEIYEQKVLELQSILDQLSKRNGELETSLLLSNQDFAKLKMHSVAINEENKFLHRKLTKTCSKYYSYPWSEFCVSPMFPFLNGGFHQPSKAEVGITKSWEEVSEKLIEQMKLEMKELQELGRKVAINDLSSSVNDCFASHSLKDCQICPDQDSKENSVEESISDTAHNLELLKQHLRDQHKKLSTLLSQTSQNYKDLAVSSHVASHIQNNDPGRKANSVCSPADWEISDDSERKFTRPSDDSFRAYFTQQLSNSKSTEELKCMMNFYLDSSKNFLGQSNVQSNMPKKVKAAPVCGQTSPKGRHKAEVQTPHYEDSCFCLEDTNLSVPVVNNSQIASKNCFSEDERVCPICEAVFPRVFSQKEFESHVVAHLEAESASLLDQYEIL